MSPRRTVVTKTKEPLSFLSVGAGRAARMELPALQSWNETSSRYELVPRRVDPVPGRALALTKEDREQGISSEAIEAAVEEVLASKEISVEPVVMHLDRAGPMAKVLSETKSSARPVLGYQLIKPPHEGELWGLRFALFPGQEAEHRDLITFLSRLDELTAPAGSSAILGEEGDPIHLIVEEQYRFGMGMHLKVNLLNLVARLPSKGYPIEVTDDGLTSMLLIIREGSAWRDPEALAQDVLRNPPRPLLRGQSFCVAEVTPLGIRLHKARLRQMDGRLSVYGQSAFDKEAITEAVSRREAEQMAREAARRALVQAEKYTLSLTSPVLTTD